VKQGFHVLQRKARARTALIIVTGFVVVLVGAFFRAQILRSDAYALESQSNRLRPLPVEAPRGTVYDRNGRIAAENVPGYSVSILPAPADTVRNTLERIRPYLDLSDGRIDALMQARARYPRQPLLVEGTADLETVADLEERRADFPGVFIEMRPTRSYPPGASVGHVMGYVGEITSEELDLPEFAPYEQGMRVGKDGIERQYEGRLQGMRGIRYLEVDAVGRIVGSYGGTQATGSVPGQDLRLTLDLELMDWIHRVFPDSMSGAVVVLNVEDGGVLALYSAPAFDPNLFVGGIETDEWEGILTDPQRPLFNRATMGKYAPASPFKVVTAALALDMGVVEPDEVMPISCTGGMVFGNRRFRCWRPEGHGPLDMTGAIQHSCNVYFYQLGLRMSLQGLLDGGNGLGFARQCGIDLPRESPGTFPQSKDFWVQNFGYRPTEGEVLSMVIGQGPNSQTPLKMAQFFVAVARDGTAPAPFLVAESGDRPEGWSLNLSDRALEVMREGMRRVTAPGGTAHLSSLEHWDFIGKTGTAQNPQDLSRPHAWFTALAGPRGQAPEIVVVTLVEFGESGSAAAAPLAAKVADFYLRRQAGMPIDTIQTLGEHYRTGTPAPWATQTPEDESAEGEGGQGADG
jgi:penicillin-binding protein 2